MIDPTRAFNGFAVPDIDAARAFYADVLGVEVTEENDILQLHLGGGTPTFVYPKPDHQPATYTILNFPVPDVEAAVDDLTAKGVTFERYEGTAGRDRREGCLPRRRAADRLVHRPGRQRAVGHPARRITGRASAPACLGSRPW